MSNELRSIMSTDGFRSRRGTNPLNYRPGHVHFHAYTALSEQEFLEVYYSKTHLSLWIFLAFIARFLPPFCMKLQESIFPLTDNRLSVCRIDVLVENNWTFKQMANVSKPSAGFCVYYDLDYKLLKGMTFAQAQDAIVDDPRFLDFKDKSTVTVKECTELIFSGNDYKRNITEELGVYCEGNEFYRKIRRRRKLGYVIGGILAGALTDLFGRRTIGIIASTLWFTLSIAALPFSNVMVRGIIHIFVSALATSVCIASYVNLMELAQTEVRYLIMFTEYGAVLGSITSMLLKNRIPYWKYVEFLAAIFIIPIIFMSWYILESPRWLWNKRKKSEAYDALRELGCDVPDMEYHEFSENKANTFKNMWLYLFVRRTKHFCLLVILLFSSETLFYYTIYSVYMDQGSGYASTLGIIIVMSQTTSFLYFIPFYVFFGKRLALFASFLLRSTCLFMIIVLREMEALPEDFIFLTFDVMQRTAIRTILALYVSHFFPTFVRATILGILWTAIGLCGLMLDSMWIGLANTQKITVDALGVLLSACGFLVLLLPETKRTELPNQKIYYIQ